MAGQSKEDPIMQEVRANRAAYCAMHGNDLKRIFEDLRKRQETEERPLIYPKSRPGQRERKKRAT
jgi:hypothetical protein